MVDIGKQLKNTALRSEVDVEAFLFAIEDRVSAEDVLELAEILQNKSLATDLQAHALRCLLFRRIAEKVADRNLFVPLVRALKNAGQQARAAIAEVLPKINHVGGHGELCEHFRSQDPQLRRIAAQIAAQVGGRAVFTRLEELVLEKELAGRLEVIDVLVGIGNHHAIAPLQRMLPVAKPTEKLRALKLLGDAKIVAKDVPGALKAIATALSDSQEQVAVQAIQSFSALCSEDEYFELLAPALDSPVPSIARAAVEGLGRFSSTRVVAQLQRKLRAGPNVVRLACLGVLESIGTDDVLSPLVEALGHKQLMVRTRAGEVLTRLSQTTRIDMARTVIWLLRSRDVNVRRMAVEIARSVKDPTGELWPRLLQHLRDEDWWVRERVIDALVQMAGTQLLRPIVALLDDPADLMRRFAVDVLIRLKATQALGSLVRTAQNDRDWWVRERAVEAIGVIKDARAIPHVVDLMMRRPEMQVVCLEALAQLDARAAVPHVASLLASDDSDVRAAALRCLGALEASTEAGRVQPLALDPVLEVSKLARELLVRWNFQAQLSVARGETALDRMLIAVSRADADDLIVAPGRRPYIKKEGVVMPLSEEVLGVDDVKALIVSQLSARQIEELEACRDVDFSHEVKSLGLRFRVNVFRQLPGFSAVFRIVKGTLPDFEKLGLPPIVASFGDLPNGLVLVGGPTGSGKSTTLAALIDYINRTSARHIISLEDPIEVVHRAKKSLVNQREIGTHTTSFGAALRSTLREDPDVILIGEMRDLETIAFAVTAAETGHLVFGTVHTVSADNSVDRMINNFPPGQQDHVRSMLAGNLRAVLCQYLLPRKDVPGRVVSSEILINNEAVANLIRKNKTFQIPQIIATGRDAGMQTMDWDLMRLLKEGKLKPEDAFLKARSKKEFEPFVPGAKIDPVTGAIAAATPVGPAAAKAGN